MYRREQSLIEFYRASHRHALSLLYEYHIENQNAAAFVDRSDSRIGNESVWGENAASRFDHLTASFGYTQYHDTLKDIGRVSTRHARYRAQDARDKDDTQSALRSRPIKSILSGGRPGDRA